MTQSCAPVILPYAIKIRFCSTGGILLTQTPRPLRSPGSDSSLAISVDYKGGSWGSGGSYVREDTNGVRPAMHLNLASSDTYSYAGTVCSDGTKNEVAAPDLKYENPIPSGENTNKGNSGSTHGTS